MKVVVVATDANGNIDVDDFRAKAAANADNLAAAMITYPSTHGVFEETRSRNLRDHAREWRPGLPRRRQHECPCRPCAGPAISALM